MIIKLVRLTTGEEILCKIKEDTPTQITVTDPVQLIPNGDGKIGFMPYMSYCDIKKLPIKVEHIMFIVQPEPGLIEKYNGMVGNRSIEVPKQKIII
jgi:hypothetical protein